MKALFLSFLTIAITTTTNIGHTAGWYTGTINRIQTKEDKSVSLFVNSNNHECGSTVVKINNPDAPGADWIYSSLLAYQAQKRKIQFYIASCSNTVGLFTKIEDID